MTRLFFIALTLVLLVLFDLYAFQAVKTVSSGWDDANRKLVLRIWWLVSAVFYVAYFVGIFHNDLSQNRVIRQVAMGLIFTGLVTKLVISTFLLSDDLRRGVLYLYSLVFSEKAGTIGGNPITRSQFLSKLAIGAGALPFIGFIYGFLKGGYKYQLHEQKIGIVDLPEEFEGLKIAHLSDIHAGSFFNKEAVRKGIKMLMDQKPDVILFTGDLVNNYANELEPYMDVFSELKAPMGIYSVLGNHDYSDYVRWETREEKKANLNKLMRLQEKLGWQLLVDEHRVLERNGSKIVLAGVGNWGTGGFARYGKLDKTMAGVNPADTVILMSHDPSHWDAQVRADYPYVNLTLSGHTHGMQFGIEVGKFKWSPAKFRYKQWAGLYEEGKQYLYVNRGFGFIGYPGRLGIFPEVAIHTLSRKA